MIIRASEIQGIRGLTFAHRVWLCAIVLPQFTSDQIIMRNVAIGLSAVLALSGCAQRADSIAPAYVSASGYQGMSCGQLADEAQVVSSRALLATGAQDKKASSDAAVTAVGLVVFWPALFFVGRDGATSAEVSRLKGEMQAIQDVSRRKGCKIQFAPDPASNKGKRVARAG